MTWEILEGDVRRVCRALEAESFDACLSDPPYGLSFMGKRWDYRVPNAMTWAEVLRVLKPGAFAIMFGGTRTYHRLVCAIEDGGFWPVDQLDWLYGQGFAKTSVDVSKAIDKKLGAERPVTGRWTSPGRGKRSPEQRFGHTKDSGDITAPGSPEAQLWDGYGTALKPAHEPALLCCKPSPLTIAETALRYGVGGLAVDASRVGVTGGTAGHDYEKTGLFGMGGKATIEDIGKGRWPANVVLRHAPGCTPTGEVRRVKNGTAVKHNGVGAGDGHTFGIEKPPGTPDAGHGEQDVEVWCCAEDCPVRLIDQQSGHTTSQPFRENTAEGAVLPFKRRTSGGYSDAGGASRYFKVLPPDESCRFRYQAKVSRGERDRGLEDAEDVVAGDDPAAHGQPRRDGKRGTPVKNDHPTLKPLALVRYFARMLLVPPHPDGRPRRLLVPFCGSGSEMIGALQAGWDHVVGIELDPRHADKARRRIARGRIIQNA